MAPAHSRANLLPTLAVTWTIKAVAWPLSVIAAFTEVGTTTRDPSLSMYRTTAALRWSWVTCAESTGVRWCDAENGSMASVEPPSVVMRGAYLRGQGEL